MKYRFLKYVDLPYLRGILAADYNIIVSATREKEYEEEEVAEFVITKDALSYIGGLQSYIENIQIELCEKLGIDSDECLLGFRIVEKDKHE